MNDSESRSTSSEEQIVQVRPVSTWQQMKTSEDWWAVYLGGLLLGAALIYSLAAGADARPLKGWFSKPASWTDSPLEAFASGEVQWALAKGTFHVFLLSLVSFGLALKVMGTKFFDFLKGFWLLFVLATLSLLLASQTFVKEYNLEYALWALAIGLVISNVIGTPAFVRPAVRSELYIKTGLVMLGAEILIGKLISLGIPGICIAWIVTPVVLISTYIFGQKVLKMESKSLNMVISADMSVCGVSAAIATAAACRAKKEELSFAIGLSLTFTVLMMIVMPPVINALGLNQVVGGAWVGGTIDSTGAVGVAAVMLGETAKDVAVTVKLIQNILIGITAFFVAVYWVTFVDRSENSTQPRISEIWHRFPKFIIGFVGASLLMSYIDSQLPGGKDIVKNVSSDFVKLLRGWFFCLAFVSIGLETNFRELAPYLKRYKPLMLYVCGQSLNLILTLAMAWLMFEVVFPEVTQELLK